ncbi:hypothetical protein AYI68_g6160, partial [Smittium mucronatum]
MGNRFIITAIDYLTKWPMEKDVSNVPTEAIIQFIKEDIISNFVAPKKIITDNSRNFISKE